MKKILLTLAVTAGFYSICSAQMYVSPSSYVFVNDQFVYVTQDVNLDNTGNFYLRNKKKKSLMEELFKLVLVENSKIKKTVPKTKEKKKAQKPAAAVTSQNASGINTWITNAQHNNKCWCRICS